MFVVFDVQTNATASPMDTGHLQVGQRRPLGHSCSGASTPAVGIRFPSVYRYVCMCICLLVCLLAWLFDCLLAWLVGWFFVCVCVCVFVYLYIKIHGWMHMHMCACVHR